MHFTTTSTPTAETPWSAAFATVTASRSTYNSWSLDDPAEFLITFSYSAEGKVYTGKYKAGSPKDVGDTFEISFNPDNPQENTGEDPKLKPWVRAFAIILGTLVTLILIKFFPWAVANP
jgi:hypothetical protein